MNATLSILLVEQDCRHRMRLAAAVAGDPRFLLAECAASGRRALDRLALVKPDIVLIAAALADTDARRFVPMARSAAPFAEIIACVGEGEEQAALDWLAAGAAGCVSKSGGGAEIAAHLLQLHSGVAPILAGVARLLVEQLRALPRAGEISSSGQRGVTAREAEVLRMLACGCTYQQASARLGISLHTVTTHIKSVYRKLDVHSAGAAVMRAVELRIIARAEAG